MASESNKKTAYMLYLALIFMPMFQSCFSAVQFDTKMKSNSPNHSGYHLIFPVQGDVYPSGVFHTSVTIGNPPLSYFLDIDTGSNVTWIQCKPAGSENNTNLYEGPHPPYKPNSNGNIVFCKDPLCAFPGLCKKPNDQCDYQVKYADQGSSFGVMLKDSFLLQSRNGNAYRARLAFGCGYDQQMGKLRNANAFLKVDGVLGLSNGKSSIVSQLSNAGFKNAHGHCFSRHGGGFLFIGDHATPSGTMWTEMFPNQENHYLSGPADLIVGKAVAAKGLTVVFDSGSTYTYLNAPIYQATLALVNKEIKGKKLSLVKDGNLPICWKGKNRFRSIDEVKSYFSPLVLRFNNAQFLLPPEAYLIVSNHGNVCLGILNGTQEGLEMNMIGAISFQDKLLIYDNEKRWIGWAPFNCK